YLSRTAFLLRTLLSCSILFFFNATPTTEIYTLSLHDALPIYSIGEEVHGTGANMDNLETHDERKIIPGTCFSIEPGVYLPEFGIDRKSTRLNSSHRTISYAVFCLKKKTT